MRIKVAALAVSLFGLCLGACSTTQEQASVSAADQPPIVQAISQVIPLGGVGQLPETERQAIVAAVEMLSPTDAVHVSISVPRGDGAASLQDEVRKTVKQAGVPGSQISVVSAEPGTGANVAVTSYVLSPAACNAWQAEGDFDNRPHPGTSCVVNRNLYLMIADPRDLVAGRSDL